MSRWEAGLSDVGSPLADLADQLDSQLATQALQVVGAAARTKSRLEGIRAFMDKSCEGARTRACTEYKEERAYGFVDALFDPHQAAAPCKMFFAPAEKDRRDQVFSAAFAPPNRDYSDARCAGMTPVLECYQQHALTPGHTLQKTVCQSSSTDVPRDFRNILYALSGRSDLDAYEEAIQSLAPAASRDGLIAALHALSFNPGAGAPPAATPARVAQMVVSAPPRDEVAAALRMFARGLIAYEDDPRGLRAWLQSLEQTLASVDSLEDLHTTG